MAVTLAELLASPTREDLEAKLIAALQGAGLPATDWLPGSTPRSQLKMTATGLVDVNDLARVIASGRFLGYAKGDWLRLKAEQDYGITPAPATSTIQRCRLTCALGSGPYNIVPGQLIAETSDGARRYVSNESQTVPAGGSVFCLFIAEAPGKSYGDAANTITRLITPLPGLSITNPTREFGGTNTNGTAKRAGSGSGTLTPSGTPAQTRSYRITITAGGQVGAAVGTLEYTVNGVWQQPAVALSPILASHPVPGDSVTLTFANGAINPSFVGGDVYTFNTPGTPIVVQGADAESEESLVARCRSRWPSLSAIPTADRRAAWVQQCSIEQQLGITKIKTSASQTIAGMVDVVIATSSGAPSGSTVTAVQDYLDLRAGVGERPNVVAASNYDIALGGSVTVRASQLAAVQQAADDLWRKYIAELPIGGDLPGGVVRMSELVQALMDAGAVDYSGLTLDGSPGNAPLSSIQVATIGTGQLPSQALTWLAVP